MRVDNFHLHIDAMMCRVEDRWSAKGIKKSSADATA